MLCRWAKAVKVLECDYLKDWYSYCLFLLCRRSEGVGVWCDYL